MEFGRNDTTNKYGVRIVYSDKNKTLFPILRFQVSKISAVYDVKQYVVNSTAPDPANPNQVAFTITLTGI